MTGLRRCHHNAVRRTAGAALLGLLSLLAVPVAAPPAGVGAGQPVALPVRIDPVREQQWQLDALRADEVWRLSTGEGVTVAVVDSGVDGSHPDLVGQVLPGIDLVARDGDADAAPVAGAGQHDPVGHGTTVAALIAGRNDDNDGVAGLAPRARILPVRVLDEENRYDDALIVAQGVRWAVDNGAQVINLSLGGGSASPALEAAIDYAFTHNVVVVACTGNVAPSTAGEVWYPAREPGVIAVTGLDRATDRLWSGAITGPETVLSAPATGLLGARPGGFWQVQGTSFAAPLVAATAALVRAKWPAMSAGDIVHRLTSTARDLGAPGRDDRFGFGLVDPLAALTETVPEVGRNQLDNNERPGTARFGPAPGYETGPPTGSGYGGPGRFGGGRATGPGGGWAATPTGDTDELDRTGVVGGAAAVVALLGVATLLAWRLGWLPDRRSRRRVAPVSGGPVSGPPL
ncbi:type VII secretion-associated serine protease mycosin [Polymorphospora sp. NPDC051019]|uniref:type VII secretion-associated serine protease mycosin n=1 Tax=Polymorphospora sp. NPDC051019 TaxID=3155725 RepID=UPI003433E4D6